MQAPVSSHLGYRCPVCRSIDWFHDGCLIAEDDATGDVQVTRIQASDPRLAQDNWSCNSCAHELLPSTILARGLRSLELRACR
jgi:hypothetical protein